MSTALGTPAVQLSSSSKPTEINFCGGEYLLVPRQGVKDDVKSDAKLPAASVPAKGSVVDSLAVLKLRRAPGAKKLSSLRTKIVVKHSASVAANNAFNAVVTLTPMSTSEQSAIVLLFDEYKVHTIEHHWRDNGQIPTAALGTSVSGAVAYDPVNSATYGSVAAVLEASQHHGPMAITPFGNAGGVTESAPYYTSTPSGMWSKKYTVPPPMAVNPNASVEIIGGQWVSTSDTTAVVGYLKPYLEVCPGTHVFEGFIVYDVTFRSRT